MIEMKAEEIVSELTMTSSAQASSAVVLVEGETDQALYGALFKEAHSRSILILPAGERELVVAVLDILSKGEAACAKLPPVVAVIDQDYEVPLGRLHRHANVFPTDLRDTECMMFSSEALKGVCDEYIDWNKAAKVGLNSVADVRASIIKICTPLGMVRYWSQATKAYYKFKRLDVSECLDREGTNLDFNSVLNKLRGAQDAKKPLPGDAFPQAEKLVKKEPHFSTALLICRGHDLTCIFAAQLRKKWGKTHARSVDGDAVERNLRMAFPRFWNSYQQIKGLKTWFSGVGLGHVLI